MNKYKLYSFAAIGLLGFNLNRFDLRMRTATPPASGDDTGRGFGQRIENRIENKIDKIKNTIAFLRNVKVTAKDATSITVDNGGTSLKINITADTHLRRKFGAKSSIDEISVNDMVNVYGKWTDDTKTAVNAIAVQDISIQKRFGAFFGEVKSISGDTFVMTTIHRDDQTVTMGTAKLVNRKEVTIAKGDIVVGARVRVKGMWDSANNTITEVKEIKDFSLPPRASGSPEPSPTPTP